MYARIRKLILKWIKTNKVKIKCLQQNKKILHSKKYINNVYKIKLTQTKITQSKYIIINRIYVFGLFKVVFRNKDLLKM